ncbi:MAG: riboflavin synthase [Alphaproteobacteria bacterium]|nr:riboflavin synthase [Alphaproteobacteria bacterium]
MFTGIVTDVGEIKSVTRAGDAIFEIYTAYDAADISIGSSISCNGVCLTTVRHGISEGRNWFAVTASAETLSKTSLSSWTTGSKVNLERSLRMGDEMGGHIVTGHVDGVVEVVNMYPEGDSIRFVFKVPEHLKHYIAPKGSVAIDGVSLTVNEVIDDTFGVNIIPHTQRVTTFGIMNVGYKANLEIDILARYIARIFGK